MGKIKSKLVSDSPPNACNQSENQIISIFSNLVETKMFRFYFFVNCS